MINLNSIKGGLITDTKYTFILIQLLLAQKRLNVTGCNSSVHLVRPVIISEISYNNENISNFIGTIIIIKR